MQTRDDVRGEHLSHAGGVVYRLREGRFEILLVRAKPAPHDWVLPKGHIEADETPEACARREIREEAGVDSEPESLLGHDRFVTPAGKRVSAAFYLMRYLGPAQATEERDLQWATFDAALTLIRFDGARRLLMEARARITASA